MSDTEEALGLVTTVESEKKKKIYEDFSVFVGKESGNDYVELEAQARAWLTKYKGIKGSETEINDIVSHWRIRRLTASCCDRRGRALAKSFR